MSASRKSVPPQVATTPNAILREWLKQRGISQAAFGRALGYKSNLAHLILAPLPQRPVTYDTLGRIYKAYRDTALLDALLQSMQ